VKLVADNITRVIHTEYRDDNNKRKTYFSQIRSQIDHKGHWRIY